MSSPPAPPPARTAAPALDAPTERDGMDALVRLVGASQGCLLWCAARAACGLADEERALTPEQLGRIAGWLRARPGLPSVVGRSLGIRLGACRG